MTMAQAPTIQRFSPNALLAKANTWTTDQTFSADIIMSNAAGPTVVNAAATATVPTFIPNKADTNTGIGWTSADTLSLIAGGSSIAGLSNSTGMTFTGTFPIVLGAAAKLYLDSGADSYLHEVSSNNIEVFTGGAARLNVSAENIVCSVHLKLLITDNDGDVEGELWYDASEDKLKFKTAAGIGSKKVS